MELLLIILIYTLSQNPNFTDSVKPLMEKMKDSQQMLDTLNGLSKFMQAFANTEHTQDTKAKAQTQTQTPPQENEKNPQSPTAGIADAFIEEILNGYLKKH